MAEVKKTQNDKSLRTKYNVFRVVILGLLIALKVVLSLFATIKTPIVSIGLSFIATAAAGYLYGPLAGGIVGGLGDVVQALVRPTGPYNPLFTITAFLMGAVYGIFLYRYKKEKPEKKVRTVEEQLQGPDNAPKLFTWKNLRRIVIAVCINQIFLSAVVNTYIISTITTSALGALLLTRVPKSLIMVVVESVVILLLVQKVLPKIKDKQMDTNNVLQEKTAARRELRKKMLKAREDMDMNDVIDKSAVIVEKLLASPEFESANLIMAYRARRHEVRLENVEKAVEAYNEKALSEGLPLKKLAYPRCVSGSEMIALVPGSEEAWEVGYKGILEPKKDESVEIAPENIDLIICPLVCFDEKMGRMGTGSGFYDRYLTKAKKAKVIGVGFELQKVADGEILLEPWDRPMDKVITEENEYVKAEK